jgi:hypothetical protein
MVDTEPCEFPKWNDATPLADGLVCVSQRRLIIKSAPTAFAVAARSVSDGLRLVGRDKNVSMPMAVIRPSTTAARIDDDPLTRQLRAGPADEFLLADRVQGTARNPRTEKVQGAQRFRAANTVGVQARLALVRHQPVVGLQAEVAVDQAGVETEVLQPRLQRGDVVAVHRRTELVIQCAGAEPVRGFFERAVGRLADDAVHQQAAMLLKRPHRVVELLVEDVDRDVPAGTEIRVGAIQVPKRGQRGPNLGDRCTTVTATQRVTSAAVRSRHSKASGKRV